MKFTLDAASVWDHKEIERKYIKELKNFDVKFNDKVYEITINDFETLIKFIEEFGDIVIKTDYTRNNKYELLIYDDYIE